MDLPKPPKKWEGAIVGHDPGQRSGLAICVLNEEGWHILRAGVLDAKKSTVSDALRLMDWITSVSAPPGFIFVQEDPGGASTRGVSMLRVSESIGFWNAIAQTKAGFRGRIRINVSTWRKMLQIRELAKDLPRIAPIKGVERFDYKSATQIWCKTIPNWRCSDDLPHDGFDAVAIASAGALALKTGSRVDGIKITSAKNTRSSHRG